MFPERIIVDGSLRAGPAYFVFDTRVPWYRALPLASVDILDLRVDREPVDLGAVTFLINDREYSLDALHDLSRDWWFTTDAAGVRVARAGGLAAGPHEIDFTLAMRIPYIVFGPHALQIKERSVKTMPVSWGGAA